MAYRIDGFKQIEAFYSWVFNNPDKIRPTHISLYLFLWNQNNRASWCEWFKCPYDLAMQGACIGNKNTYYNCLDELQSWDLISYKKGINNYKAPLISLKLLYKNEPLTEQVTVPLSEPQTVPLYVPQTVPQPVHIYNYITNNLELIIKNEDKIIKYFEGLKRGKEEKSINKEISIEEVKNYFTENGYSNEAANKFFNYYSIAEWKDSKGNKVKSWKQKAQAVWFKDEYKIIKNNIANLPPSKSLTVEQYKELMSR